MSTPSRRRLMKKLQEATTRPSDRCQCCSSRNEYHALGVGRSYIWSG
ncbi:unnamed protein product [Rhodiola kirilowii]